MTLLESMKATTIADLRLAVCLAFMIASFAYLVPRLTPRRWWR